MFASTMIAAAPIVGTFAFPRNAIAAEDSDSPQSLLNIVTAKSSTETQRQNAAVELVDLDSPEARSLVTRGLGKDSNSDGRIALAKAIAMVPAPSSDWIEPMGGLLGPNRLMNEAGAQALGNYRGNDKAFAELKNFADAPNNPAASRVEAIRAMGGLIDLEPARYLVGLLGPANQARTIQDAAADALAEMTGLTSYGTNARQWQQWLNSANGKNAEQFHAMLLESRGNEAVRLKQLQETVDTLLKDYYYNAPNGAKKAELVLKYLNSDSPQLRVAAADLVNSTQATDPPTPEVRARLFEMIGDPDKQVRLKVLQTLVSLNDANALPAMIARLKIEKDSQVKIQIATALGKLADVQAGKALLPLLNDPDPQVVIETARAFSGALGTNLRSKDPKTAADVAAAIHKLLDNKANNPELRGACVGALVALQGEQAFDDIYKLVVPDESAEVRKAALQGLATLGDSKADDRVADQLDDRDPSIRLEAAKAMGAVATPADNGKFRAHLRDESDPNVRQALWISLQKFYDQLTPADLVDWANQFNNPPLKDPDKRLATLLKLGDAYKANKAKAANANDNFALNQQDVAQAMMAVNPPRKQEAIDNLTAALAYWRGPGNGTQLQLGDLVGELLDDQLAAGQYAEAAAFAAKQIAIKPEYQLVVGPHIKEKAYQLYHDDKKPDDAKSLIQEALKMSPPLDEKYIRDLKEVQKEMDSAGQ